jgi:hypothetical protein
MMDVVAGWPANKRRCLSLFNYCNTVSDKKGFNATDGAAFISEVTYTFHLLKELGLTKGRDWFLNFLGAPMIL